MSLPPPGWYPDNLDPRRERFWDGYDWTRHVQPAGSPVAPRRGRFRRAGTLVAAGALALGVAVAAVAGGGAPTSPEPDRRSEPRVEAQPAEPDRAEEDGTEAREESPAPQREEPGEKAQEKEPAPEPEPDPEPPVTPKPKPEPKVTPKPKPKPGPRTYLVVRVVDGDTLELGNGEVVRLAGMDTPEVGQCGFEASAARLGALVLGRAVTLGSTDEDRDGYGRLLRYVDVAGRDAGLTLIREGLARARYDSRDGYGYHPREPRYVEADRTSAPGPCPRGPVPLAQNPQPQQPAQPAQPPAGNCAPGYSPCVPPAPPDLDCGDLGGPIRVTGGDPHRLDGDGDGIACE